METPALDRLVNGDRTCSSDVFYAARTELAALRAAAPQKVDGPKEEGWYWHREKNSRLKGVRWGLVYSGEIVTLSDGSREVWFSEQPGAEGSAQDTCLQDWEFDQHEWIGPLTPPAAAAGEGADYE